MAKELEQAGAHIIGIKDMAGVAKPAAISQLVTALRQEIALPIHFHTHDTSGISAASALAAVDAGVDAVDAAMDSFSGLTSQPNLGSIVAALDDSPRSSGLNQENIRKISLYWEGVRANYSAFESDIRSGASEVYLHAMPGGQYTNLKEQARSMGLEDRWSEVAIAYAEVNQMFGDIVKVTPSSKVVGDMALFMVSSGINRHDVENPDIHVAFPESVVQLFRGDLGQPQGGFPKELSNKILKGEKTNLNRPGLDLKPADFAAIRVELESKLSRHISETELSSYILYPKVYQDYAVKCRKYGNLSVLPTPIYFYGMETGQEIAVDIDKGKTLIISYLNMGDIDEDGFRSVFFELNGQPRMIKIRDKSQTITTNIHIKAEDGNKKHIAAPMPGMISSCNAMIGQEIEAGDVLLSIEAMKMETAIHAETSGVVKAILTPAGTQVKAKDLLVELE